MRITSEPASETSDVASSFAVRKGRPVAWGKYARDRRSL